MDVLESRYYEYNRIFLDLTGLWPYNTSWHRYLRIIVCTCLIFSSVFIQVFALVTKEHTLFLLLQGYLRILCLIIVVLKYLSFYLKEETIKKIYQQIQCGWNALMDNEEEKILRKHGETGRFLVEAIMGGMYCLAFVPLLLPVALSIVTTIIVPWNESRFHELPAFIKSSSLAEILDAKEYYYTILIHMTAVSAISITAVGSVETTSLTYILHSHALCNITIHRLKCAFTSNEVGMGISGKVKRDVDTMLAKAIEKHVESMRFLQLFFGSFATIYLFVAILGAIILALMMYQIFQATMSRNWSHSVMYSTVSLGILLYIYIANLSAETVTDHSVKIFHKTYALGWYTAPIRAQKALVLVLQRSTKDSRLVLGGLFAPSVEGFSMLVKTSFSYFTVLYSLQL